MSAEICPLQATIFELFAESSHCGYLTFADRYGLMAVLLKESITEEERRLIDRMLYAVRKGRLKLINEISLVL